MNTKNHPAIVYGIIGALCVVVVFTATVCLFARNTSSAPQNVNIPQNTNASIAANAALNTAGQENPELQNTGTSVSANTDTTTKETHKITEEKIQSIFDMKNKTAKTVLFFSKKLGIGFTYAPYPEANAEITVTEKGDMVYIHDAKYEPETGQSIQVFTKDEQLTLEQAMTDRFLKEYNKKDCFVEKYNRAESVPGGYIAAEIAFAESLVEPSGPGFDIGDACPVGYTRTNGVQYFAMNPEVPGKYVFIKVGQDTIAQDGSIITTGGQLRDWTASLRIVE